MAYNAASKNVLVLEDMVGELERLTGIITSLGYTPLAADNRGDFLTLMESNEYFAAILDNNAPYGRGEDIKVRVGLMLANNFLRREPGVKVALHTESEMNPEIKRYTDRGMRYMKKPASTEQIKEFLS